MRAQPSTTASPQIRSVTSPVSIPASLGSGDLTLEIPANHEEWWTIRELDWSTDRKPWPVGVIEIRDTTDDEVLWVHFFTEAGHNYRSFEPGLLGVPPNHGLRITVCGDDCTKTLGVIYQ